MNELFCSVVPTSWCPTSATPAAVAPSGPAASAPKRWSWMKVGVKLAGLALASTVGGVAIEGAQPAAAASPGWYRYDANQDGYQESAVYFDAYGRALQLYQDSNQNSQWDAFVAADTRGQPTYAWFDTNHNGNFDTRLDYRNGGLFTILSNARTENNTNWDSLYYTGTGQTFSDQNERSGWEGSSVRDPAYGWQWASSSSFLTNYIPGSPSFAGDISMTLSRVLNMSAAMHCYTYPWTSSC